MSRTLSHTACPQCSKTGRGKSLAVYEDGKYCFECGYISKDKEVAVPNEFVTGIYQDVLPGRGIHKDILEKFSYQTGHYSGPLGGDFVTNEPVHIANIFDRNGNLQAQQLRASNKRFKFIGNASNLGLAGTHLYQPNDKVFVTIVEGYIDQLSVAQACGSQFPVVSVPAGVGSAEEAVKKDLDWLQGFAYVVLALDNDEAGKSATQRMLSLFGPGKVRVATWPQKDANDLLIKGDASQIKQVLFNAIEHKPEGIKELCDIDVGDFDKISIRGAKLPFTVLESRIHGLKKNCLYSLVAREKSGKSLVTKEIVLSLIDQGYKIGLFYLEESAAKASASLVAMQENIPMWKVEDDTNALGGSSQIKQELEKYRGKGVYIYDHKGAIDLDSIHNAMVYMTKALKVDYIILDNVSVALAGSKVEVNERKLIDSFVHKCVALVNNESVSILNVAHLVKNRKTKDGEDDDFVTRADIRGSGSFAMFSYGVIAIERNIAENTAYLKVLADRGTGFEGYCDKLKYDINTGRLTTVESPI